VIASCAYGAAYNRSTMSKRSYGSARLFVHTDRTGNEWYGALQTGATRRKIGPQRASGSTAGLKRVQAGRELREQAS
jgi:hypothetical protein